MCGLDDQIAKRHLSAIPTTKTYDFSLSKMWKPLILTLKKLRISKDLSTKKPYLFNVTHISCSCVTHTGLFLTTACAMFWNTVWNLIWIPVPKVFCSICPFHSLLFSSFCLFHSQWEEGEHHSFLMPGYDWSLLCSMAIFLHVSYITCIFPNLVHFYLKTDTYVPSKSRLTTYPNTVRKPRIPKHVLPFMFGTIHPNFKICSCKLINMG